MARKVRSVQEILGEMPEPKIEDLTDRIIIAEIDDNEKIYVYREPSEKPTSSNELKEIIKKQKKMSLKRFNFYERIPPSQFPEVPYEGFHTYFLEDNPEKSIIRRLKSYEVRIKETRKKPHRIMKRQSFGT